MLVTNFMEATCGFVHEIIQSAPLAASDPSSAYLQVGEVCLIISQIACFGRASNLNIASAIHNVCMGLSGTSR